MGVIFRRFKGMVATFVLVAAMFCCAEASAGTALTGDSFAIGYLNLPANSVPGGHSGVAGPGYISSPSSTDGRYVFFISGSDNLAPAANPDLPHVFRKDTQTGDVVLVSRADGKNGLPLNETIYNFSASGDGNLLAFTTVEQVVPADTDANLDIYVRNIQAGTTTLLTPSVTDDAFQVDISADGKFVVFTTEQALYPGDSNGTGDVYRMRIADGTSTIVSAKSGSTTSGNSGSSGAAISGDGKWVAFTSSATDLVAGFTDGNSNFTNDVFIRNLDDNSTRLVSNKFNSATTSANDGSDEPRIAGSPDTLAQVKVAFSSYGNNLADNGTSDPDNYSSVYLHNMSGLPSELISRASGAGGASADSRAHTPRISDDGSRIVFSSDAGNLGAPPNYYGVYLRDRGTNATSLVSYRNDYAVEGTISGDGHSATWGEAGGATADSDPDLASVFKRILPSGEFSLVSRPKGSKPVRSPGFEDHEPSPKGLSATGRYAVFTSSSVHLPGASDVPGETSQVYRRDLKTGAIELVSRASGANGARSESAGSASVSSDGMVVAFYAQGALVPDDTNDKVDVYARNLKTKTTTLVSRADGPAGAVADESSYSPMISGDGNRVGFVSSASNLGGPGTDDMVFVRDIAAKRTFIASRADGEAGTLANAESGEPSLNHDGSLVAFTSHATNLSPDDPAINQSIYLRNLASNTTLLVSRAPGLTGASLSGFSHGPPVISGNGSRVAFITYDEAAVPATAPWPISTGQVVVRNLSDGDNILASISSGGQPGDDYSSSPSFSRDGSILAFATRATNLRDDIDNTDRGSVVIRNLTTGEVSGPPLFGVEPFNGRSDYPSVSDSGDCVSYKARGHNQVSGNLGDVYTTYVYVRSSTCLDPRKIVPKLSQVRLKPKKFRVSPKATAKSASKRKHRTRRGTKISFNLNTRATVTVWIERKLKGRKAGKKCVRPTRKNQKRKRCTRIVRKGKLVRKDLAPGKRKIAFSGRIGRKALKPGKYRVVLQAVAGPDRSNKPVRPFKIVRR